MIDDVANLRTCWGATPQEDDPAGPDFAPRAGVDIAAKVDESKKFRILLVEDHPMLRERLAQLINQNADMEVCGEADDREDGVRLIGERAPDLVIVDLSLRHSDGLDLLREIQEQGVQTPALVLSMHEEVVYVERALQAGARGYVPKSEASSEVIRAIRKVLAGEVYLNEWMTSELIQRMAAHSQEPREMIMASFSDRELEVLKMIGQGRNTHEMARELGVSESTVAALRLRVKHRLGAKDTAELYHRAVEWVNEQEHSGGWRRFHDP